MSAMKMLLVVFLVGFANVSAGTNPGINGKVTTSGIEFVKDVVVGMASEWIENYNFPNFYQTISVTNVVLESSSLGNIRLVTKAPDIVNMKLDNANLHLTGKVAFKFWFFSLNFGFSIRAIDIDGTLGVKIGVDSSGRPTATLIENSCTTKIEKIIPEVTGTSYAGAINYALTFFESEITDWIEDQVCPTLEKLVDAQGDRFIAMLPTSLNMPWAPISIDISLVEAPVINANSISLSIKGDAFPTSKPWKRFPGTAPSFPKSYGRSKGFYFVLSDYSINSLLFALRSIGWFEGVATPRKKLPFTLPFSLTPRGILPLAPGLSGYKTSSLILAYSMPQDPTVEFSPGLVTVSGTFNLDVQLTGGTLGSQVKDAFSLSLDASIAGNLKVVGRNITGKVTDASAVLSQTSSAIGNVKVEVLNRLLAAFMPTIITQINALLESGMAIPSFGEFSTRDETIAIRGNSIEIAGNIYHDTYSPRK